MSGLIGGAGSKSGVIGTTELDYEEGDWTPGIQGTSTGGTVTGKYKKIGDVVYIWGQMYFSGTGTLSRIDGCHFNNAMGIATQGSIGFDGDCSYTGDYLSLLMSPPNLYPYSVRNPNGYSGSLNINTTAGARIEFAGCWIASTPV